MIYLTSDLMLNDWLSIKKYNRPFLNVDNMNNKLFKNFKSILKEKDELYILGNLTNNIDYGIKFFKEFEFLKIYYMFGSDDYNLNNIINDFKNIVIIKQLTFLTKYNIILSNHPLKNWEGKNNKVINVHGGAYIDVDNDEMTIDVGIDNNKFCPVSIEKIIKLQ